MTPFQGSKTVTVAGTPEPLVAVGAPKSFTSIEFQAIKSLTVPNTGDVYIRFGSGASATEGRKLAAGDTWSFTPSGRMLLSQIWVDAGTNGDGVFFTAIP